LFDSMNVEDNIAFPVREHKKMTEEQALHRVDELLTILNIPNIQNRMPSDLSGGMRKRVALARALIMEPEVMLYDEPTTGLDPVMIKQVDEMIHTAAETNPGLTSIVISHDMASTFRISDQIVMLHLGKIVESGSPEVVVKSKVPQVQEFIEAAYAKPKGM
jgi:phospholipid/cholesterol/gamma-HCH transport system ATP-binding protein